MAIDWATDYQKKFEGDEIIATLKERRFHGKLIINFTDGSPHTSHIEMCVKPYASATTSGAANISSSTLKGGGG